MEKSPDNINNSEASINDVDSRIKNLVEEYPELLGKIDGEDMKPYIYELKDTEDVKRFVHNFDLRTVKDRFL